MLGWYPGKPLDVLAEHVGLEVDAVAGLSPPSVGHLAGVRNQRRPRRRRRRTPVTVRLTPSTAIEPFSTT